MRDLPSGTLTFFLTDIEGSTRLWEQHPQAMEAALARHDTLAAQLIAQHGGTVVKHRGEGDSLFAVFSRAMDAASAAAALQSAFQSEPWPEGLSLQVRMALHTGDAAVRDGDYFGAAVNRCARLRTAAHGGQVLLSAATQELTRDHLPEGLSLLDLGDCRLKDLIRPERVYQLLHPEIPADFPPLRGLDATPNNLPVQPTPLIGRDLEVATVVGMLHGAVRLVTLTGPGGTGKTRLSFQVAADLLDDFPDGVFFVDLAPISEPELVASTIAQTLGVRESGGQSVLEGLKNYLREKHLVLLIDNFEQVLDAAPVVAELLGGAPRLKVLLTSRVVLRVRGEHEFAVPPLALPDPKRLPPVETLSQYAAVELFIQRAIAAKSDFAVTNENAAAVAEICVRLDGLPLAIELAAARIRLFSPQTLLSRLGNRLKLLVGGARDLPIRQQTLRATITWSYDLLTLEEQRLFRRLAVFVGGCTLEAAEAICNAEGDLQIDVLDGLASLVDKKLLVNEDRAGCEPRFTMLETIREFANERLAESDEAAAIRQRHVRCYLALGEEAEPHFTGPQLGAWMDRIEREHGNIRAGLVWALTEGGAADVAVRLAGALWRFWHLRGYGREGHHWLTEAVAADSGECPAARAKALRGAGFTTGDGTAARRFFTESLAIYRKLEDRAGIAACLNHLGNVAKERCEWETAQRLYTEAIAIDQEIGDRWGEAIVLANLGELAWRRGDLDTAWHLLRQSLVIKRELADPSAIATSLWHMGR
jgi:predicted ATPase/class 3 adenylate cyclase